MAYAWQNAAPQGIAMTAKIAEPSFAGLFTPKLITVLREGYGLAGLRADVVAGLTVAIVALPLSMAIAIASGVSAAAASRSAARPAPSSCSWPPRCSSTASTACCWPP
jgi:hypothetical protein